VTRFLVGLCCDPDRVNVLLQERIVFKAVTGHTANEFSCKAGL
jgi:hypothetical protein